LLLNNGNLYKGVIDSKTLMNMEHRGRITDLNLETVLKTLPFVGAHSKEEIEAVNNSLGKGANSKEYMELRIDVFWDNFGTTLNGILDEEEAKYKSISDEEEKRLKQISDEEESIKLKSDYRAVAKAVVVESATNDFNTIIYDGLKTKTSPIVTVFEEETSNGMRYSVFIVGFFGKDTRKSESQNDFNRLAKLKIDPDYSFSLNSVDGQTVTRLSGPTLRNPQEIGVKMELTRKQGQSKYAVVAEYASDIPYIGLPAIFALHGPNMVH